MDAMQKGFTLVELAIVLMIIGILIGGVLRGQELVANSRVGATIKQVTSYSAAMTSFLDKYASLPGDMVTATNRVPGCITQNSCRNGDGDGLVGAQDVVYAGGQQSITTENTQFWKHLALSHMITGVDPSASQPVFGKTHPASVYPGGFTVIQSFGGSAGATSMRGLTLRLHNSVNGTESATEPVSPKVGAQIDRKMDDGIPNTGDVQASASGVIGTNQTRCEVAYDETSDDPWCMMMFMMKR